MEVIYASSLEQLHDRFLQDRANQHSYGAIEVMEAKVQSIFVEVQDLTCGKQCPGRRLIENDFRMVTLNKDRILKDHSGTLETQAGIRIAREELLRYFEILKAKEFQLLHDFANLVEVNEDNKTRSDGFRQNEAAAEVRVNELRRERDYLSLHREKIALAVEQTCQNTSSKQAFDCNAVDTLEDKLRHLEADYTETVERNRILRTDSTARQLELESAQKNVERIEQVLNTLEAEKAESIKIKEYISDRLVKLCRLQGESDVRRRLVLQLSNHQASDSGIRGQIEHFKAAISGINKEYVELFKFIDG